MLRPCDTIGRRGQSVASTVVSSSTDEHAGGAHELQDRERPQAEHRVDCGQRDTDEEKQDRDPLSALSTQSQRARRRDEPLLGDDDFLDVAHRDRGGDGAQVEDDAYPIGAVRFDIDDGGDGQEDDARQPDCVGPEQRVRVAGDSLVEAVMPHPEQCDREEARPRRDEAIHVSMEKPDDTVTAQVSRLIHERQSDEGNGDRDDRVAEKRHPYHASAGLPCSILRSHLRRPDQRNRRDPPSPFTPAGVRARLK